MWELPPLGSQPMVGEAQKRGRTRCPLPYGISRSRLQLDLIGGGTWVNSRFRVAAEDFINGQSLGLVSQEDHTRQWYLTAGLGARYSFSQHVEGVLEYTLIRNTQRIPAYVHLATLGNRWGLTRSISLGLRYRFNGKKQAG
jgi:hypothetical protein